MLVPGGPHPEWQGRGRGGKVWGRTCLQPHNLTGSETNDIGTILLFQKILTQGEKVANAFIGSFRNCLQIHLLEQQIDPPLDLFSGQQINSSNAQDNSPSKRLFTCQASLALTVSISPELFVPPGLCVQRPSL